MFGHDFGILVYALLCGGDTKFKLPKAGNGNIFFGGNDTTGCTQVILRHNRVFLFIQLE